MSSRVRSTAWLLSLSLAAACASACGRADSDATTPETPELGNEPPESRDDRKLDEPERVDGVAGAGADGDDKAPPDVSTDGSKPPTTCAGNCPKPDPGGDTTGFDDPPDADALEGTWTLPWLLTCADGPDFELHGNMRLLFEPANDAEHVEVRLVSGGGIPGFSTQIVDRSASIELPGASPTRPEPYSSVLSIRYQRVRLVYLDRSWDVRAEGTAELVGGDIIYSCTFQAQGVAVRDQQLTVATLEMPATPLATLQVSFDEPIEQADVTVSVQDALGFELAASDSLTFNELGTGLALQPLGAWPPGEPLNVVIEGAVDLAGNEAGRIVLPVQLPAQPAAFATGFDASDTEEAWPGCLAVGNHVYGQAREVLPPQGDGMLSCTTACDWSTYASTASVVARFDTTAASTLSLQLALVATSYGPVDLASVELLLHGPDGVRSVTIDAADRPTPVDELHTGFGQLDIPLTGDEALQGFWLELRFSGQCDSTGAFDAHTLLVDSLTLG